MLYSCRLTKYLRKEKENLYMSKGVAVRTIILFLLGLLVLVIVAYMVYRVFYSPTIPITECRTRWTSYCTSCKVAGWPNANNVSQDLRDCAKTYWSSYSISSGTVNCSSSEIRPPGGICTLFIGNQTS